MKVQLLPSVALVLAGAVQSAFAEEHSAPALRASIKTVAEKIDNIQFAEEEEEEEEEERKRRVNKWKRKYAAKRFRSGGNRAKRCLKHGHCLQLARYCEGNWCDAFELMAVGPDTPGIYLDAEEAVYLKMEKDIADGVYEDEDENEGEHKKYVKKKKDRKKDAERFRKNGNRWNDCINNGKCLELARYCEGNWCDAFEFMTVTRDTPAIYLDAVESIYLKMKKDIADGVYVEED